MQRDHSNQDKKNQINLSESELRHLQTLIKQNTLDHQTKIKKDSELSRPVYVFHDNKYVIKGALRGQGFWGKVKSVKVYTLQNDTLVDTGMAVVKSQINHDNLDYLLNTTKSLQEECRVNQEMVSNDICDFIQTETRSKKMKGQLLLPDLGSLSLTKLISDHDLLASIPLSEYIKLFITYAEQLNKLHTEIERLHKDLKPDNLLISVEWNQEAACYEFSQMNIIDYGINQKKNVCGLFGDPRYQPYDSFMTPLYSSYNNEKIDIYSLSKSLLPLLQEIKDHHPDDDKNLIIEPCERIFYKMQSYWQTNRPSLDEVIKALKQCQQDYEKSALSRAQKKGIIFCKTF